MLLDFMQYPDSFGYEVSDGNFGSCSFFFPGHLQCKCLFFVYTLFVLNV